MFEGHLRCCHAASISAGARVAEMNERLDGWLLNVSRHGNVAAWLNV